MSAIIVCPLSHVPQVAAARRPSHLITLLGPDFEVDTPHPVEANRHLRIAVNDIADPQPGLIHPCADHLETILSFGEGWDGRDPLLVHCWAGVSRSTAAAFVIACARNPGVPELSIAQAMRRASPTAYPNRLMIALADELLGRSGRMIAAREAMGASYDDLMGSPFELPAVFEETGH
jgi:predicted protein tyrosine phosphatase